jgi:D-glycero-D-manno-heptose 1,7-bisphosphate phosphatase
VLGVRADRVVILDRDGVINRDSDLYIKSLAEWIPLPGSIEAIARLSHAGYRIAVASNQSGLARGKFQQHDLDLMHQRLRLLLAERGARIEMIVFCPHGPDDQCPCRKPLPGMLLEIGHRMAVDLTGIPFIGDSLGDIMAARAVGARPWIVRTGKGERTVQSAAPELAGVTVSDDLAAAVETLLDG